MTRFPQVFRSYTIYNIFHNTSLSDTDDNNNDNNNDEMFLTVSRGTSPVDSTHSGNTVVYEVEDSDDDIDDDIAEVPAESAEAELSK
jgi:hypothetical protein